MEFARGILPSEADEGEGVTAVFDAAPEDTTGDVTEMTVGNWFVEIEGDTVGEEGKEIDPEELDEDGGKDGESVIG
jgi:hypothetical protein